MQKAADLLDRAEAQLPEGLTIADLEAADGNTYPPYVARLAELLVRIGQEDPSKRLRSLQDPVERMGASDPDFVPKRVIDESWD